MRAGVARGQINMLVKLLHRCMGELKTGGECNSVLPWYSVNAMPEMFDRVCICVCVYMCVSI